MVDPNRDLDGVKKWDLRFMEMAKLVASWSKDPSTKTGAVIIRPDRTVLSVGFNGFPRLMQDAPSLYEDRDEKYSRIINCEMNAMLHASDSLKDCCLYTWPFASCDRCVVHMAEAGVKRFVFPAIPEDKKERWGATLKKTVSYLDEMGLLWVEL